MVESTAQPGRRPRPHEVARSTLSRDTHPAAEAVQLEILRRMTPARKMELIAGAIRTSRALALCGLRRRNPRASEEQLHRLLMDLLLGEELAHQVYGPIENPETRRA